MKTWEVTLRVTIDVRAENNAKAINQAFKYLKSFGMEPGNVIFTTSLRQKKAGALSELGRRRKI